MNSDCFGALHKGGFSKGAFMTANRANWYETFESYALFYPKLSAAIALETLAAAALVETTPSILLSPARHTKKRATSRKSPNGRKKAKRGTERRKAA